jgi:phenylalanine-4-hydroxylase
MLADPKFADMVQAIGMASLGADEKTIWHLTKVYWYTVEFGVVKEGDAIKAFGAGVLSSYGELEYMGKVSAEGGKGGVVALEGGGDAIHRERVDM